MPWPKRKFGNKTYTGTGKFYDRRVAKAHAKKLRDKGHKVRITRGADWYRVWWS